MKDSFDEIEKTFDHITKELEYLNHHQVVVGFFGDRDSLLLTIVRANEYGAHIVPKNKTGYLWVPSRQAIKEFGSSVTAKDVAAKYNQSHPFKFFVPKGKHVAVVSQNNELVVYFYLLKEVKLPARAFIRKTAIDYRQKYNRMIKAGVEGIMYDNKTGKQLLKKLGRTAVSDMREVTRQWTQPENSPLTINNKKGANNPLVDTGLLQKRITCKILPAGDDK